MNVKGMLAGVVAGSLFAVSAIAAPAPKNYVTCIGFHDFDAAKAYVNALTPEQRNAVTFGTIQVPEYVIEDMADNLRWNTVSVIGVTQLKPFVLDDSEDATAEIGGGPFKNKTCTNKFPVLR